MVDRVVLDVELANAEAFGEAIGFDQGRESGVQAGQRLVGDGQELAIPPQVLGSRLDQRARDQRFDRGVVIRDFERAETLIADPEGSGRKRRSAQMTTKAEVHAGLSYRAAGAAAVWIAG